MKQEHINEIKGVLTVAAAIILLASLVSFTPLDLPWYTAHPNVPAKNFIRITGAYLAGSTFFTFGYSSYFFVVFLFFLSWNQFTSRQVSLKIYKFVSLIVLLCILSALLGLIGGQPHSSTARFERAGFIGLLISDFLAKYIGKLGSYVFLIAIGTLALILVGEFLVTPIFYRLFELIREKFTGIRNTVKKPNLRVPVFTPKINVGQPAKEVTAKTKKEETVAPKEPPKILKPVEQKPITPKISIAQPKETAPAKTEDYKPKAVGEYQFPALDLLDDPPQVSTNKLQSTLMNDAKLLEETLANFGVSARVADIERGPAITRYELEPAPGVKVQQVTALENDIALAMRAQTLRIVAPIPGKNRIGIEVPNAAAASVYLKEVLMSEKFRTSKSKLTLSLGKDTAGYPIVADLADMPHLLIAGTTGSGKTVCVNGLIMSVLLHASPDEVKFILVDPKMVELAQYNDIPHLLCPTVTDAKKASAALGWVVTEMENRYKILSKEGVRNISGYNEKGNQMPYIIVIIDELADLMQTSAKTVESAITRLAQLSRAVGIHLVLATQRPSVNVITGVIKANFPARVSFKVASKVDSRTVLDMNGAETLLGKGDMLFMKPGDAKPTRGQCSFVKDEEIHRVVDFIKSQREPVFNQEILKQQTSSGVGGVDEKDDCFDEAVKVVVETNQASVSILQRRLRLGYTRAARLIDMMEQAGIVGPYVGSKARDILVDREQWLLQNMNTKTEEGKP